MTEDKKTKYVISVSVRVGAQPEGTYSSREVVNTTRQNETQELDAIPAATFHAAKEAVQGALIGMGTNPARIGLSLPGTLEAPETLPRGEEGDPVDPDGVEAVEVPPERREGSQDPDGLEEQDDPDEDDLGARPMGSPIT